MNEAASKTLCLSVECSLDHCEPLESVVTCTSSTQSTDPQAGQAPQRRRRAVYPFASPCRRAEQAKAFQWNHRRRRTARQSSTRRGAPHASNCRPELQMNVHSEATNRTQLGITAARTLERPRRQVTRAGIMITNDADEDNDLQQHVREAPKPGENTKI